MMSLPSCEAETRCRRSVAQCMAYILARWPLRVRRVFMAIRGSGGISLAIVRTRKSAERIRGRGWGEEGDKYGQHR